MPRLQELADAPHYQHLLVDYGKLAVTLSLALLSLSVAFVDKLAAPPLDLFIKLIIVGLWLALAFSLLCGLSIIAHLTGVASNYAKALGIGYPSVLQRLREDGAMKLNDEQETLTLTNEEKELLTEALNDSRSHAIRALKWAKRSFVSFGVAAVLLLITGGHGLVLNGKAIDATHAILAARSLVENTWKNPSGTTKFSSVTYDSNKELYEMLLEDEKGTSMYTVVINAATGKIKKATKTP